MKGKLISLLALALLMLACSSLPFLPATELPAADGDLPPVYTELQAGMFPSDWLNPPISITADPLSENEVERTLQLVGRAMRRYPPGLLSEELDGVYLTGSLRFSGVDASGTNSLDRVYVVNGGKGLGYTDDFVESTFHHEFSSILLRNHPGYFAEADWRSANPSGFEYGSGGVDAILEGPARQDLDFRLYESGFLNEYSLAGLEEDFNEIAENLFMGMPAFWSAVDHYPALAKKVDVMIAFYHELDPMFTEDYFR